MIYNRMNRRLFLRGAGAALMLPVMESLMPYHRAYGQAASIPPVRYIQMMSGYGFFAKSFYPTTLAGITEPVPGIRVKRLADIAGPISSIIDSSFDNFRNKMSFIRGMHVLAGNELHNSTFATCAASPQGDALGSSPPVTPYSIDDILQASAKIYPNPTGKVRHVNFCPTDNGEGYTLNNYSWTRVGTAQQKLPNTDLTSALLAKFMFNNQTVGTGDPTKIREGNVINAVFGDYKAVRDGARISAADKTRLDAYMTLISDIQKGLGNTAPAITCSPPNNPAENNDPEIKHRNQINILVAAMACQLTNVASYIHSCPYDPMHDYSHNNADTGLNGAGLLAAAAEQRKYAQRVSYLLNRMNQIGEANGTMLDNSIVYWGNEYGENYGYPHCPENMTAMVAGGAAGQLKMGELIDYGYHLRPGAYWNTNDTKALLSYRRTGGIPMNNFLITLMNAMGLSSADYEKSGAVGFGEYNAGQINNFGLANYTNSNAAKRAALPYFYLGAARG